MGNLFSFFKLIRIQNLFLIALSQFLFQYYIIRPMFYAYYLPVTLPHFQFALLVLITVLIAAGGNLINDFFDYEVDMHNRPQSVIINKGISDITAQNLYYLINLFALGIGIYLTRFIDNLHLMSFFIFCFVMLWLYSSEIKRKVFFGNFIIALLASFTIIIVWLFERNLFNPELLALKDMQTVSVKVFYYTIAYTFFAFMTNFIREIIKDIEDSVGDEKFGKESFIVKYGMKRTKQILSFSYFIFIVATSYILYQFILAKLWDKVLYSILCILFPLLYSGYLILKNEDAKKASIFIKIVILLGILSMIFF